jgi:hypothetical protein
MTDIKAFIRKWQGRTLQDDGCHVSKEFHSFQVAFINAMRKIARNNNAEIVNPSYGHYDMGGFFKKDNKYVYFSYSNGVGYGGRTYCSLKYDKHSYGNYGCCQPLLIRTAKHDRDYTGGTNNFCPFSECEEMIIKLLSE